MLQTTMFVFLNVTLSKDLEYLDIAGNSKEVKANVVEVMWIWNRNWSNPEIFDAWGALPGLTQAASLRAPKTIQKQK